MPLRPQPDAPSILDMDNQEVSVAILRESLRLRCIQAVHATVPMSGALGMVGALLWPEASHGRLLAWLLTCFATTLVAAADCGLMVKKIADASARELAHFNRRYVATSFLNTIAMGAGIWWLASISAPETGFFVTLCLCFYAIGHVVNGSSHLRGFLPALFANLGQPLLFWLMQGGLGSGIAIMLAGIIYLLWTFAQQNAKNFSQNVRMRFANLDLVAAISDEKAAVERALSDAREASLAKSRFLAAASHDLRQPLHALSLWTGLLRESLTDPIALQRLDKLAMSVDSLNKLFSGLLDLSRLDGGSIIPEKRAIHLGELLALLGNDMRAHASAQGLVLHVGMTQAWVHSDPVWLERILRNLLDNAIKYTKAGGSVSIGCTEDGEQIRISVRDTGIGIAPQDQVRVFEEYFQIHNPSRDRSQGVGLGLAIVKRACDLLGHAITLRSEPGQGSEFSLEVPRGRCAPAPSELDILPPQAHARGDFSGMVVVVIEDDQEVMEATDALLREWGCITLCAPGADEAISGLRARGLRPHGLIADYRLSAGASGTAAIAALQRAFPGLPAALVSGELGAAELQTQEHHPYAVLQKPLTTAKLRELLKSFRGQGTG